MRQTRSAYSRSVSTQPVKMSARLLINIGSGIAYFREVIFMIIFPLCQSCKLVSAMASYRPFFRWADVICSTATGRQDSPSLMLRYLGGLTHGVSACVPCKPTAQIAMQSVERLSKMLMTTVVMNAVSRRPLGPLRGNKSALM